MIGARWARGEPLSRMVPPGTAALFSEKLNSLGFLKGQVAQAHEHAWRLMEREHDYEAAAQVLEQVPEHLRDGALYQDGL
jgi:hypothetical protein